MINSCPICDNGLGFEVVLSVEKAAVQTFLLHDARPQADDFETLEIVRCGSCGHLLNRLADEPLYAQMYGDTLLSNIPVHVSMVDSLRRIAEWIGHEAFAGKRVVEIGAGTGHLARIVAEDAAEVTVFEPCLGLTSDMLPEKNITLINQPFDGARVEKPVDLVICRQVIEHLISPDRMIADIRRRLTADGLAYLEVPRAEFIVENGAICDLHLAHIQYFGEAHFSHLAAKCGLRTLGTYPLKNGHDMGFLLCPVDRDEGARAPSGVGTGVELRKNLLRRIETGREFLSQLSRPSILYCATRNSQAFLGFFEDCHEFHAAFDDNLEYQGYALYGRRQVVPIAAPSKAGLSGIANVIIANYLHQAVIAEKLRHLGFEGRIITALPMEIPANEFGLEGMFGPVDTVMAVP